MRGTALGSQVSAKERARKIAENAGQRPPTRMRMAPSLRIGVWAEATLATDAGGWRPINRVGLPMIHPLFTQFNGLVNRLNAGRPADDFATYGEVVRKAIVGGQRRSNHSASSRVSPTQVEV